ncbi:ISL3 family transposase [Streptacidiphilus sp. EB129]|uniref:ISL3 family transposase n=1 Tax=Streptacidiphilus sp. EB129 TaxID=3156262 RepID=UPI003511802A
MREVELDLLLPQLAAVEVEEVRDVAGVVRITARTRDGTAVACSGCGRSSDWVHSRYVRHVADEAVGGRPVTVELSVRRLYCENPNCPKTTFAEQVDGLTVRYQRRSTGLQAIVVAVATALAGKAGSRLLLHLHHTLSWASLLTCLMKTPDPPTPKLRVVAVDDFALRRGRRYATLMIDAESRLPVDAWDTRDTNPTSAWLRAHRGIEVVCRDGSAAYRSAITAGAPQAVQVSDRFHLWQNLGRKIYEVVTAHRDCLPEPDDETTAPRPPGGLMAARTRRVHTTVHALLAEGMALRAIGRHMDLDRNVVRRHARAATWQEVVPVWPRRAGILGPYQGHLHRRWAEGEHNIAALAREITARGFRGSEATVRLYLTSHREALDIGLPPPAPARSAFEVTRLLTTRPKRLDEDQRLFIKHLLERCPELRTLHSLVRSFRDVFDKKRTVLIDRWITSARQSGLAPLVRFSVSLQDDIDAVHAAVALPYNSGVAEGRITDLKLIKRQMAGRAGIHLLRKRVILVAHSRRSHQPPPDDDLWLINAYENLV